MSTMTVCSEQARAAPAILLDHERMNVYTVAVELDGQVVRICRKLGRGHAWLRDQAQNASGSAVLNVAEGLGREGADRGRHLRIARGSTLEVDAAMTLLCHRGACKDEERARVRELCVRVVSMLTRMVRSAS
jgi:four helix bundle protein